MLFLGINFLLMQLHKQNLAKLYGFATSGQSGPSGSPDISGIDEEKVNT
jgi:hypothetical protein